MSPVDTLNTIKVTLSEDDLEFVRSRISSGEYASENDVLLEGLEALKQSMDERHRWEQQVLLPAHDRMMADPSSAISMEQLEHNLELRRQKRLQAR